MEEKLSPKQNPELAPPAGGADEALASPGDEDGETRANFPVFMKLIVIFLVFTFVPFLVISSVIAWNYDASVRSLLETAALAKPERGAVMARFDALTHDLRIRIGFLFILFSAFSLTGINVASRILVKPLTEFLNGVRRLARGEFGAKITRETSDEFAIFADYFNRMSTKLEQIQRREQWVSQQKSELMTIAAHQLRTPLTAVRWILGNFSAGAYGPLNAKQQKALEKGASAAKRMIHLINSLLDVTAIEEGRFGYRFRLTDLKDLVEKTVETIRVIAENRKITITIRAAEALPPVWADPDKIQIVLENILNNALRYTPEQGTIEIALGPGRGGDADNEAVVSIKDSGIGIKKEDRQKIFTRFFRSAEAASLYTEGAGLGLYITRNIIQRHGGRISAESEPGRGSVFTFTLPAARQKPHEQYASEEFFQGSQK